MNEKEELEARIKALEERLTPLPEKVSSIQVTEATKADLRVLKLDEKESSESVIKRLIERCADKVKEK
jgi:cell division septum initiation protein DivIVA